MTDIDEILASGRYTDRRGRKWQCRPNWTTPSGRGVWEHAVRLANVPGGITFDILDPDQMSLLIERDQHRDVCPGLRKCMEHPVPYVWIGGVTGLPHHDPAWGFNDGDGHGTLPAAMEAARALAVES